MGRLERIIELFGYKQAQELLNAIERGELAVVKLPGALKVQTAVWLREQAEQAPAEFRGALNEIAGALEYAHTLDRYPVDVCDLDAPPGWPSYCERD